MFFASSGIIFFSQYPLQFYDKNIIVDLYQNLAGFVAEIFCNYSEAYIDDQVVVTRATFYCSQERIITVGYLV